MRVRFRQSVQTVTSFIYLVIVVYHGHSLNFFFIIILDYVHTQREHIKTDDISETTL